MMIFSTMSKMLLLGTFFLLFIHLSSAAELVDIFMSESDLHVNEGSHLIIPCRFRMRSPVPGSKINFEWGTISEDGSGFQSIIHLYDNMLEPADRPNQRAQVFISHLPNGDCTLVIEPVTESDSGFYELRVWIGDQLSEPFPSVQVIVSRSRGFLSRNHKPPKERALIKSSKIRDDPRNAEPVNQEPALLVKAILILNRSGYLLYALIAGGIFIGLLMMVSMAGVIFGIRYFRLKRRCDDRIRAMEEGRGT